MKKALLPVSCCFALALACIPVHAQPGESSEEIVVKAPMSLSKLRREIGKAEDAMFDLYNELNDDDQFDINCRYVKRWQSVIRERVCSPNFLVTAQEEEVNNFISTLPEAVGTQKGGAGVNAMNYNNALLKDKMDRIYRQHPEFKQALDNLNSMKQEYEERRQAR